MASVGWAAVRERHDAIADGGVLVLEQAPDHLAGCIGAAMVRACKLLVITTTSNDWSLTGNGSTPL